MSERYFNDSFKADFPLLEAKTDKKFPHSLLVTVVSESGQAVWFSENISYLISREGKIVKNLPDLNAVNTQVPIIDDLSNAPPEKNKAVLAPKTLSLIHELDKIFKIERPGGGLFRREVRIAPRQIDSLDAGQRRVQRGRTRSGGVE